MHAFQEFPRTGIKFFFRHHRGQAVQLTQIGARAEPAPLGARKDARARIGRKRIERRGELFQLPKNGQANLVRGFMVERQLKNTIAPLPPHCLSPKCFHSLFLSYIPEISSAYRAAIAPRRNLPLTVSRPFSTVNASRNTTKPRTCR